MITPERPAVLVRGTENGSRRNHGRRESIDAASNGDGFMQKPFRIGTLRDRVREILDMPRPIRKVLVIDDEQSICELLGFRQTKPS